MASSAGQRPEDALGIVGPQLVIIDMHRGRYDQVASTVEQAIAETGVPAFTLMAALTQVLQGDHDAARQTLDELPTTVRIAVALVGSTTEGVRDIESQPSRCRHHRWRT
jgi:hypothetical protein